MSIFDDPVAEALAGITEANPAELAEYVRALASTRPNVTAHDIGQTLLQDAMVTATGKTLDDAVGRALRSISRHQNEDMVGEGNFSRHENGSTNEYNGQYGKYGDRETSRNKRAGGDQRRYGADGNSSRKRPLSSADDHSTAGDSRRRLTERRGRQSSNETNVGGGFSNRHTPQSRPHARDKYIASADPRVTDSRTFGSQNQQHLQQQQQLPLPPPPSHPPPRGQSMHQQRRGRGPSQGVPHHPNKRKQQTQSHRRENRLSFTEAERMLGPPPQDMPRHVHERNVRKFMEETDRNNGFPVHSNGRGRNGSAQQSSQQTSDRNRQSYSSAGYGESMPGEENHLVHGAVSSAEKAYIHGDSSEPGALHQNSAALPPPPPPPPPPAKRQRQKQPEVPVKDRRTLLMTNIPPHVTMVELSQYLTNHKVAVVSMKLLHPDKNDSSGLKKNTLTAHVQCGSHGQAISILKSPEPVLANRFIRIKLHGVNLEEGRPEVSPPAPAPTGSVLASSLGVSGGTAAGNAGGVRRRTLYCTPKAEARAAGEKNARALEASRRQQVKQLELLQAQEKLLEKQLAMQKKMLSVVNAKKSASAEEKQKVMKDILATQKKAFDVKKEILEITSKSQEGGAVKEECEDAASLGAKLTSLRAKASKLGIDAGSVAKANRSLSGPRKFSLDRRTKTVLVEGLPEGTAHDELFRHFQSFGNVDSVALLTENSPLSAKVAFSSRAVAEKAKSKGTFFNDATLTLSWYNTPSQSASGMSSSGDAEGAEAGQASGAGGEVENEDDEAMLYPSEDVGNDMHDEDMVDYEEEYEDS